MCLFLYYVIIIMVISMNADIFKSKPILLMEAVHAYALNDLDVEPEMKRIIIGNLNLLKQVDPQEIYRVLKEIMVTKHPDRYIREFKELFFTIIPGLSRTYAFEQNNPWHIYDVFEHTMHVIENTKDNEILRMAALFHDIGKPLCYSEEEKKNDDGSTYMLGHFYRHNIRSNIIFEEFAKRVNIPEEEKDIISKLIIYHDYHLSTKPQKIQGYINDLGVENIPLLFALKRADNLAQNPKKTAKVLEELEATEAIFNEYINNMSKKVTPENQSRRRR